MFISWRSTIFFALDKADVIPGDVSSDHPDLPKEKHPNLRVQTTKEGAQEGEATSADIIPALLDLAMAKCQELGLIDDYPDLPLPPLRLPPTPEPTNGDSGSGPSADSDIRGGDYSGDSTPRQHEKWDGPSGEKMQSAMPTSAHSETNPPNSQSQSAGDMVRPCLYTASCILLLDAARSWVLAPLPFLVTRSPVTLSPRFHAHRALFSQDAPSTASKSWRRSEVAPLPTCTRPKSTTPRIHLRSSSPTTRWFRAGERPLRASTPDTELSPQRRSPGPSSPSPTDS